MIDTRFSTALQIVISIAVNEAANIRCTSQDLADGIDTNPSFVRKLLVPLSRDGILASSAGNKGGVRLGRSADKIKLSEIYRSVATEKKLWATRRDLPDQCFVTGNVAELSENLCKSAECAVIGMLEGMTVKTSIEELLRIEERKRSVGASRRSEPAMLLQALDANT